MNKNVIFSVLCLRFSAKYFNLIVGIILIGPLPEKISKILTLFLISGIIFFVTSNGVRNQARILQIFSDYGTIRIVPTMRLQYLAENLRQATENDDIFVHTLNNDIPRSVDFVVLAKIFCAKLAYDIHLTFNIEL